MRFDDLQRKPGGDTGIERIAAFLQNAHPDRGGNPMGGGDDTEGPFDFRPGRERIGIDFAHWIPSLVDAAWRAHLTTAKAVCQPVHCIATIVVIRLIPRREPDY